MGPLRLAEADSLPSQRISNRRCRQVYYSGPFEIQDTELGRPVWQTVFAAARVERHTFGRHEYKTESGRGSRRVIRVAHSPDSDDAFMFFGLGFR